PKADVRERCVPVLSHCDCQNSKSRSHGKILVLIRFFATAGGLMMNAFRGRYVVHLPALAETVAEVQILAWRTAREERCKTTNRFKGFTLQGAGSAADPLAAYWLLCVRWESIGESSSYQAARFEAFHATMHDCAVNAPKQSRRSERLIGQVAHRCAYVWISPDRLEEFLGPVSVN